MKRLICLFAAVALVVSFSACVKLEMPDSGKDDEQTEEEKAAEEVTYKYANFFIKNSFSQYYLWSGECSSKISNWLETDEPGAAFEKYKFSEDRWGFVTDDYESLSQAMEGISKTAGMDIFAAAYKDTLAFCVSLVYADSPARKAGVKRGDIFTAFDGEVILLENGKLSDAARTKMNEIYSRMHQKRVTFKFAASKNTVSITPVEMYEDPIICSKVFNCGGKKVGYLFYNAFVLDSVSPLLQVFRNFKNEGISELILDLRYNGGGDVVVENVIASVLAPKADVDAGSVFTTRVYNSDINTYYDANDPEQRITRFSTSHQWTSDGKSYSYDTSDLNLGIKKLNVIYSEDSASASEALIVGLGPYLDIHLYGKQTYGKYCTCALISGEYWYDTYKDQLTSVQYSSGKKYAGNWACYVTLARFADKNGKTGNYPDGFAIPEANQVDDLFYSPIQIGNPEESMLAKVLKDAGYTSAAKSSASVEAKSFVPGISSDIQINLRRTSFPAWGFDTGFAPALKELE